jgi:hypothetical protein
VEIVSLRPSTEDNPFMPRVSPEVACGSPGNIHLPRDETGFYIRPIVLMLFFPSNTMTKNHNELHVAEDPIRVNRGDDKEFSEHVEEAEDGKKGLRDIEYDDQEDSEHSRTGIRKLLRRNPSYNFIRDVAITDETPLNPAQVKRVGPCHA